MDYHNFAEPETCGYLGVKLPKGKSLTPKAIPRCTLKIPDRFQVGEEIKHGNLQFPLISKSKSAATPIRISPRILKNKDYEFPDVIKHSYKVIITDDNEMDEIHKQRKKDLESLQLKKIKYDNNLRTL